MSLEKLTADRPFDYRATKSGMVTISYKGRIVTTLRGREASRFLVKLESETSEDAQLVMAKATGHFKHDSDRAPQK